MSSAQTLPTVFSGSSSVWEGSLYAFLAEKQRRSGSLRTPDSYYRTLRHFFGSLQKAPDQVSPQDVFSFAHGVGLSGREPSPVTVGARLSCISSFFKFLIRLDLLNSNPCDPVERPKPRPSAPSGLSASQVQQLLQVIPDTLKGRRDLAIVLTLVLTGRRRSEIINLTAGDIAFDDSAAFYRYVGKGGVRGRRELPSPALSAIRRSLGDVGKDLASMQPCESLWQAGAGPQGVSSATFYNRFRGYLRLAGLPPRASMSSATPPPSYAATSASRSNRSASSSITARSPSPQLTFADSRVSAMPPGMASPCARRELAPLQGAFPVAGRCYLLSPRILAPLKLSLGGSAPWLSTPTPSGCRSALTSTRLRSVHTSRFNSPSAGGRLARSHSPHSHLRPRLLRRTA